MADNDAPRFDFSKCTVGTISADSLKPSDMVLSFYGRALLTVKPDGSMEISPALAEALRVALNPTASLSLLDSENRRLRTTLDATAEELHSLFPLNTRPEGVEELLRRIYAALNQEATS